MIYDMRLGCTHPPGKAAAMNIQSRVKREHRETRADMMALRMGMTGRRQRVELRTEMRSYDAAFDARLTRLDYQHRRK